MSKFTFTIASIGFLTVLFTIVLQIPALAQPTNDPPDGHDGTGTSFPNPLSHIESLQALIGVLIRAVFGIVGSLALMMFIYGGIVWMVSEGNTERLAKGKNIIIWATIGLLVMFSSYAIVKYIFDALEIA